jgi:hypothetical protein
MKAELHKIFEDGEIDILCVLEVNVTEENTKYILFKKLSSKFPP